MHSRPGWAQRVRVDHVRGRVLVVLAPILLQVQGRVVKLLDPVTLKQLVSPSS
jgi:hypothetical protein